jgi:hypothetical protein
MIDVFMIYFIARQRLCLMATDKVVAQTSKSMRVKLSGRAWRKGACSFEAEFTESCFAQITFAAGGNRDIVKTTPQGDIGLAQRSPLMETVGFGAQPLAIYQRLPPPWPLAWL